jgi:hypothetical protein
METKPFRLLDLPPELRLVIYERLPCTINHREVRVPKSDSPLQPRCVLAVRSAPAKVLATCKLVHSEAKQIITNIINEFLFDNPPEMTIHEDGDDRVRKLMYTFILNGIQQWKAAKLGNEDDDTARARVLGELRFHRMHTVMATDLWTELWFATVTDPGTLSFAERLAYHDRAPYIFAFIHQTAIYQLRARQSHFAMRLTIAGLTHPASRLFPGFSGTHPNFPFASTSVERQLLLRYVRDLWLVYDKHGDKRIMVDVNGL